MQLPGIVARELDDGEDVAATASLGGDDRLVVAAGRTLVYRAGGVLSDESVEVLSHDVARLTLAEGRRKATLGFEYAVEPDRELAVPLDRLERVLQPLLAAVMRDGGVTAPGERVHRVFSFSELTLAITDERLLKHVGAALWDDDHESIPLEAVTDLSYEEGSVATGVVLTVDGRKERLKAPNDRLPEVREHLESALLAAHDAASLDELGDDAESDAAPDDDPGHAVADFGGVDALDTGRDGPPGAATGDPGGAADNSATTPTDGGAAEPVDPEETAPGDADAETTAGAASEATLETDPATGDRDREETAGDGEGSFADTPFTESVAPEASTREELAELRAAVERQNELLRRHSEAIERLVETLRD